MGEKATEVKKDVAELELLLSQAKRQKVKDILSIEIRKLVPQSVKYVEEYGQNSQTGSGWDQSSKFLKLYVTLPLVETLPVESVTCNYTSKSVELYIKGLDNKDFHFTVKNLLNDIDPNRSSWKIRTDMVVISLAKVKEVPWSHVTEVERKVDNVKKPLLDKLDKSKDPEESLVSMIKNMYDTGDDDMKRTIAKAWTEGQTKKLAL